MLRPLLSLILLLGAQSFGGHASAGDVERDVLRALRANRIMRCPTAESCNQQSSTNALDVTIAFSSGSARLGGGARLNVQKFAARYRAATSSKSPVTLSGYTDGIGGEEYNRRLSNRRAIAVRRALIGNGLPPKSINTVAYGIRHAGSKTASPDDRVVVMRAAP